MCTVQAAAARASLREPLPQTGSGGGGCPESSLQDSASEAQREGREERGREAHTGSRRPSCAPPCHTRAPPLPCAAPTGTQHRASAGQPELDVVPDTEEGRGLPAAPPRGPGPCLALCGRRPRGRCQLTGGAALCETQRSSVCFHMSMPQKSQKKTKKKISVNPRSVPSGGEKGLDFLEW